MKCLLRRTALLPVLVLIFATPKVSSAWGPKGHALVGQIAMQYVKPEVRQNLLSILGDISIDTAANWMDIMRSNQDYDYMKPWHYIDFPKEELYKESTNENIVNRLIITYNDLKHRKTLSAGQVKTDLLVLMHLMGDIHQPLHTGYDDDLGGNKRAIQFESLKTNLHHFWDEDIIDKSAITLESCLALYSSLGGEKMDTIDGIYPALWMKESRSLLDKVYAFPDFTISQKYLDLNSLLVKKQLLLAGLRLASVLNKVLYTPASAVSEKEMFSKYKNGVDTKEANSHIGKKVTVCSKTYGIKTTDKVTFINMGERYPKSPVTIVIKAQDRKKFIPSIEELYNDKNICVQGTVVEYQGKVEIVVTSPDDIIVQ